MKLKFIFAAALTGLILSTSGLASARGHWGANQDNTRGWQLMTPAERTEHQTKMRGFKTYDECSAYQEEHHKQMEVRAKEKGVTLPAMEPHYGCGNMKARGYLK